MSDRSGPRNGPSSAPPAAETAPRLPSGDRRGGLGSDLAAVILLAGRVGTSAFAAGIGRNVVDLPLGGGRTVLDLWASNLERLAEEMGMDSLRVRVAVDRTGPLPRVPGRRPGGGPGRVEFEVIRDPSEYRGTAGVVRDLTADLPEDARVVVGIGSHVLGEPVGDVLRSLAESDEGVSLVPCDGGDVAGLFLLRCARLREVPEVGFVDLKEQALPASSARSPLAVARRSPGSVLPVRTLAEYVSALRRLHPGSEAGNAPEDPFAESWRPAFHIVEPGADVAPGALLQDSVVLAGAVVEPGAAVIRSVVCPGASVRRGECVVERVVTP